MPPDHVQIPEPNHDTQTSLTVIDIRERRIFSRQTKVSGFLFQGAPKVPRFCTIFFEIVATAGSFSSTKKDVPELLSGSAFPRLNSFQSAGP